MRNIGEGDSSDKRVNFSQRQKEIEAKAAEKKSPFDFITSTQYVKLEKALDASESEPDEWVKVLIDFGKANRLPEDQVDKLHNHFLDKLMAKDMASDITQDLDNLGADISSDFLAIIDDAPDPNQQKSGSGAYGSVLSSQQTDINTAVSTQELQNMSIEQRQLLEYQTKLNEWTQEAIDFTGDGSPEDNKAKKNLRTKIEKYYKDNKSWLEDDPNFPEKVYPRDERKVGIRYMYYEVTDKAKELRKELTEAPMTDADRKKLIDDSRLDYAELKKKLPDTEVAKEMKSRLQKRLVDRLKKSGKGLRFNNKKDLINILYEANKITDGIMGDRMQLMHALVKGVNNDCKAHYRKSSVQQRIDQGVETYPDINQSGEDRSAG